MFSRILIANRGEIALRLIRTCKEMGIESVAVYSAADKDAHYLDLADEAVCIGPPPPSESYLNIPHIISAAEITDVDAIHPGYGFLAESGDFAEICEAGNIVFIGPPADVLRKIGDKAEARKLARSARIPVIPGSEQAVEDDDEAIRLARQIGYPVMVKACAGGGGRGMRIAHNDISLKNMLALARNESQQAFKRSEVYVEKYLHGARHVEIQILADRRGSVIHLGERDCSIQRRHQKLMEETPAPGVRRSVRQNLCRAAVKLARLINYVNAGTIEFLLTPSGDYYFIEMNPRLQVEHTITEVVTGLDIVQEQIRIAAGEKLRYEQKQVKRNGVAIECRLNAENPTNGFSADPGTIRRLVLPGGRNVRVDSHVYTGYSVPPYYDSMVGKVIAFGPNRDSAIRAMQRALSELVIEGISTTVPLYQEILQHARFRSGKVDLHFVDSLVAATG